MSGSFRTQELDSKLIAYHVSTAFLVQIGRGKSAYRTKYKIVGNLTQAVLYYNGLNVGNGYKKRLLMPSARNAILARQLAINKGVTNMKTAILAIVALVFATHASAAKRPHMPRSFCRELVRIHVGTLAYVDTLQACEWDYSHPVKRK
jgi:hypothetical protein